MKATSTNRRALPENGANSSKERHNSRRIPELSRGKFFKLIHDPHSLLTSEIVIPLRLCAPQFRLRVYVGWFEAGHLPARHATTYPAGKEQMIVIVFYPDGRRRRFDVFFCR
jgi:hypothetical protein